MSNIYKLIEYLVENWQNNLFEALAPKIKQQFVDKFKQEADDFNVEITDKQLSDYIDFFDSRLKNNPKVTEKDLNKYTLQSLIKLVSSFKGSSDGENLETTPDIVYNENGIIIYNGNNEENCLNFGKGEKWCITKGSFANYRYDQSRKNPTFYLVKDTNLPSSDPKSFFVVVVGSDNTYKVSDRSNNDVGGRGTEWDKWEPYSFVEQNFPSIQGLQRIFKYIPISKSEAQGYKDKDITIGEWLKAPFDFKEQYLVVKKGKKLFRDINNQTFVSKVLPKIPQIAEMISKNYGYIDIYELLQEFDSFSTQNQKSIIANASRFTKIQPSILESDAYPWSAKKAIVKSNILQIPSDQVIYLTKDDKAIVKLTYNNTDIQMGIFTENEDYPNVKINERTGKFITDYPNLDQLPFALLVDLAKDNILPKEIISKIVEKAKTSPDSALVIRDTDEGQILIDSNVFKAYKIENGTFTPIPFENESVQNILTSEEDNNVFQDKIVKLFAQGTGIKIPMSIAIPMLKSTPYDKRLIQIGGENYILLTTLMSVKAWKVVDLLNNNSPSFDWEMSGDIDTRTRIQNEESWKSYFDYLRNQNISYGPQKLIFKLTYYPQYTGERFLKANPPLSEDNIYKIIEYGGQVLLINKTSPMESRKISSTTGKLVKFSIPSRVAAQLLGTSVPTINPRTGDTTAGDTTATEEPSTRRRGRPSRASRIANGEPLVNNPAVPQEPQGNVRNTTTTQEAIRNVIQQSRLTGGFDSLPQRVRRRFLLDGRVTTVRDDRGATRRNSALGARGRVIGVISAGQSKFYIIQLASGTNIGSVATQPDAQHFIVTSDSAFRIPNAGSFISQLQARNLSENAKALISLHAEARPQDIEEIKYLLKNKKHENK